MTLLSQNPAPGDDGPPAGSLGNARRWTTLAWAAVLLWAILVWFIWSALSHRARLQTESLLEYAMLDLGSTLNGSIDTMLMRTADSVVSQLGEPKALPTEQMALIARQRGIDEVNITARDGVIVASSDPRLVGRNMANRTASAEFLVLTNGVRHALSHNFRPGAHNPDVRRKYMGVAFPGGNGLVQVGLDENHVVAMFPSIMGFVFDEWLLGKTGFFLCADMADGHLISNPAHHRDKVGFLAETGYDASSPAVREDAATTFRQQLFGETCDCRAMIFCGHRLIAALPPAEYYDTRTFYVCVMAVVLAAVLALVVLLVRNIDISSERLQAFYDAEEERRARDMGIAKTIQNAALPAALPASRSYQIDAAMQAARDVGGDFYDYFALDPTHVAFLVADVSGKGITAALYMMTAKTLIKDSLTSARDPAAALARANSELCANNPANMFITAWVGVLDLDTGVVSYASAGHNPPVIVKAPNSPTIQQTNHPTDQLTNGPTDQPTNRLTDQRTNGPTDQPTNGPTDQPTDRPTAKPTNGPTDLRTNGRTGKPPARVSFVTGKSGPILAFMDGIRYKPLSLRLAPGDALFLYTDGVTEALDSKNVLFGEERLANSLASVDNPAPHMLCSVVRLAVAAFSEGVPQADDITVLAIRRTCAPGVFSRSFQPSRDGIAAASDFLDEVMADRPGRGAVAAHVVLDEICSNIVKHSGASGFEIELEIMESPNGVKLTFIDDGVAYDPLAHTDPDTTLSAEERPIGGLGIFMVKKMASSISYHRCGDRNFLFVELLDGSKQ